MNEDDEGSIDPQVKAMFATIGEMIGNPGLSQVVLSGRLTSKEILPLFGGMVGAAIETIFMPLTGAKGYMNNFMPPFGNPEADPIKGFVTLLDGSQIHFALHAVPAPVRPPR